jgi:hypothetical protein
MSTTRRTIVLGVCGVVVVALLGLAVFGRGGSSHSDTSQALRSPSVVAAPVADPSPPARTAGTAGSWPRSELGARQAAVSFLELTEKAVSMNPTAASSLQRSISSARSADRLAGDVEEKLIGIQAQVPDGLVVHVAPVAARATARGDGWDVAIWYAQVVIYGREVAVEAWTTATYALVWEGDTWRMDALVSMPGPVPTRPATLTPTPVAQLLSTISGFDDEGLVR